MTDGQTFAYVALGADGKRVRGQVQGPSEQAAFERLRRQGLSPLKLRPAAAQVRGGGDPGLGDRESAEVLLSLADLLEAGADMRSALNVLLSRAQGSRVANACRRLLQDISAGEALDAAFARTLAPRHGFVAALVAAGEASGDLPQALRRAGEMLEAAIKLRQQLVGALAYPLFVLISTLAAAGVILLAVVPSLEPLVSEGGEGRAPILSGLLAASRLLREQGFVFAGGLGGVIVLTLILSRAGLLARPLDRLWLAGPWRRTTCALAFGGFAISLGSMLTAGAPMSDALRLAIRGVRSDLAKTRLRIVLQQVRQGVSLSQALQAVKGFPPTIVRLVSVGESAGALGRMLQRSGKLEEDAAVRDIEAAARLLGPVLIVLLGGLIGLMMAGLLSGVTELGQAALN
ncbi:type II secretion system F family protein [Caulobacter soli]|uniref:type II secretion system F family protein n=1 Tax=Caulobacter soli TaxID=2708539 RepID=UPI0013EA0C07|nr:type II secretion system F family protein [Caulobacter soli]